jgi:hypothetical protein
MLKSSNKSEIAVLKVELRANEKGYHVSLPKNQSSRYDLIIDDGKKLYRTQVKYFDSKDIKPSGNVRSLRLRFTGTQAGKMYSLKDIDLFLLYLPSKDAIVAVPSKKFNNKNSIRINISTPSAPTYYKKFLW